MILRKKKQEGKHCYGTCKTNIQTNMYICTPQTKTNNFN